MNMLKGAGLVDFSSLHGLDPENPSIGQPASLLSSPPGDSTAKGLVTDWT